VAASAPPTADYVMGLLRGVIDPELGSDIIEPGMAKGATVTKIALNIPAISAD
jgi:metal-sulfur cluster biosynthetic enzyme